MDGSELSTLNSQTAVGGPFLVACIFVACRGEFVNEPTSTPCATYEYSLSILSKYWWPLTCRCAVTIGESHGRGRERTWRDPHPRRLDPRLCVDGGGRSVLLPTPARGEGTTLSDSGEVTVHD